MVRTVFVEIKKNIPFDSHNSLVSLQQMHGVNMGVHHYEKCGAISIMESISAYMHRQLIDHMISKNSPFSIIIDGSTDAQDNKYLIVYLQILENNIPIVVFYGLIEGSSDVTANGLYESISNAFRSEKRDFSNYVRHNLVGYASDGEAVMSGQQGGLVSFFRRDSDNFVYSIHCMAHRLELAIEKAMKPIAYFKDFEEFINQLFQFYNWHNSKRKSHLKETAGKMKKKMYALNYIYRTRWISSELQSITNLKKMWNVLVTDLDLLSVDIGFDVKTRDLAKDLFRKIKGKNFVAILNFISDVLHHLSFWSLKMQERTALLVDFANFNENILDTFKGLKNTNGRDLSLLLNDAICGEGESCNDLNNYYDAQEVTFQGFRLIPETVNEKVPRISDIRNMFLDGINAQLKSYFPNSDLKFFKIFIPKNMPTQPGEALSYGVTEINNLCEVFKLSECLKLISDWTNLLDSMIESPNFCTYKTSNVESHAFWSQFCPV